MVGKACVLTSRPQVWTTGISGFFLNGTLKNPRSSIRILARRCRPGFSWPRHYCCGVIFQNTLMYIIVKPFCSCPWRQMLSLSENKQWWDKRIKLRIDLVNPLPWPSNLKWSAPGQCPVPGHRAVITALDIEKLYWLPVFSQIAATPAAFTSITAATQSYRKGNAGVHS